jgi:MASE9 protein
MQKFSLTTKFFITGIVTTGAVLLVNSLVYWKPSRPVELFVLLTMTVIASRLKVRLPGINGTMSVNVPFLLIVAVRLSAGESLAIAALASLVQSIPSVKSQATLVQALFNSATITNAVATASLAFRLASHGGLVLPLSVAGAGAAFFLANTVQVAVVLWLAEGQNPFNAWQGMARLSTPYYVLSAGLAAVVCTAVQFALWSEALALLPFMYSIYASYRLYFAAPVPVPETAAAASATRHASAGVSVTSGNTQMS